MNLIKNMFIFNKKKKWVMFHYYFSNFPLSTSTSNLYVLNLELVLSFDFLSFAI